MNNVLFFASSPVTAEPLRLDQEARDLRQQLALVNAPKVLVNVEHRWAVRVEDIQTELLNTPPQVLHFSGHGGPGELCFEDAIGEAKPVGAGAIARLVGLSSSIKCLVLNACYSETVAAACAKEGVVVIGCDASIGDDAAIAFTRAFYRAMAHGKPFKEAFEWAVNEVELAHGEIEANKYVIFNGA